MIPRKSRDEAIRSTDDDAATSRLAAVGLGFLVDPFAEHFVRGQQRAAGRNAPRRPPVINRGTYVRTMALDRLMEGFIASMTNSGPPSSRRSIQVVSLGAGTDTRYFVKKSSCALSSSSPFHRYFEIDFPEITSKKASLIKRNASMSSILINGGDDQLKLTNGGCDLSGPDYSLISGDLREFEAAVLPKLLEEGFSPDIPTLFLSECVMIYIEPDKSDSIVQWAAQAMKAPAMFLTFEQILPDDRFGQVMIDNLKANMGLRNIQLPGIYAYPTLESQKERYLKCSWDYASSLTMDAFFDEHVSTMEKERLMKIEMLDEIEEWKMLSQHYCISWALKNCHDTDYFSENFTSARGKS